MKNESVGQEELKGELIAVEQEEVKIDYDKIQRIVKDAVIKSHNRQKQELEVLLKKELDHQQMRIYKGLRKAIQNDLDGFIEKLADMIEAAIGEVN